PTISLAAAVWRRPGRFSARGCKAPICTTTAAQPTTTSGPATAPSPGMNSLPCSPPAAPICPGCWKLATTASPTPRRNCRPPGSVCSHEDKMLRSLIAATALAVLTLTLAGQDTLPASQQARVDALTQHALDTLGAPSASIAIVEGDQLVYAHAYGQGRIQPPEAATTSMRYSIGSISKQFTAAAVLLLQEQGRLKLDDRLAKYLPGFTRGNEVTVRELLSHTSGYEDYAPQDYMIPAWLKPTTPQAVVNHWARLPLNFEPGTQWQYSNTNFKLAGLIVEKISGEPFFQFLSQDFFQPLGMTGVLDVSAGWLGPSDAQGTVRHALGPDRVAPIDGTGWNFADGQLGMTAANLARWQIGMLKQSVLKPASYRAMETNTALKNGRLTGYGLGLRAQWTPLFRPLGRRDRLHRTGAR